MTEDIYALITCQYPYLCVTVCHLLYVNKFYCSFKVEVLSKVVVDGCKAIFTYEVQ